MKQDFDPEISGRVKITSVDHPIDASFLRSYEIADRCIKQIHSGESNLLCSFDECNPPVEVKELKIKIEN